MNTSAYPKLLACLASLFLAGCAQMQLEWPLKPAKPVVKETRETPSKAAHKRFWHAGEGNGAASIVIVISEQRAFFYKGTKLVGATDISSGRDGFDTPPGKYKVIQKDKNHLSNLYGDFVWEDGEMAKANVTAGKDAQPEGAVFRGAKMPFFLRFHDGYGLHAGRLPGHRASHGCVRLPREMAQHFFENAEMGTPVEVRP